jgi:general secretion pathway protein K
MLAVLLLVAVTGGLAAAAMEKLRLSTAMSANGAVIDQARAYASGVESLVTLIADDLVAASPERTTLAGGWNGSTRRIPLPGGGLAEARIRDGGNCFNLNSLAEGEGAAFRTRPAAVRQLAALLLHAGAREAEAQRIPAAAADWADSDDVPNPGGAEDSAYRGYRTGGTLFADVSELRAVAGMRPDLYTRVRPWLCVLPAAELSPLNLNTLGADEAPLLAMLAPERLTAERARSLIARRPQAGWASAEDFWRDAALGPVPEEVRVQSQVRTSWFAVALEVEVDGALLSVESLIDARFAPSRVAARRWGSGL